MLAFLGFIALCVALYVVIYRVPSKLLARWAKNAFGLSIAAALAGLVVSAVQAGRMPFTF